MKKRLEFLSIFTNLNGKFSASGVMGILIVVIGTVCFLLGCIDKMWINKDIDIITQSIIFVGIGISLLGYRKSKENITTISTSSEIPATTTKDVPKEDILNS